jgi:hypothetical protein
MRHSILLLIFFNYFPVFNQVKNDSIQIRGVGSYYKNEEIGLYVIEDYITGKEKCILQSSVDSVGFFKFNIARLSTQKLIIKSKKNKAWLYVQPGGNYLVTFPELNESDTKNPKGNQVDLVFYQLDSMDINYKILGFQNWVDNELSQFYHLKKQNPAEYELRYNKMKKRSASLHQKDTSLFFRYFINFSFAEMDDLETVSAKTRQQKYAENLVKFPVYYSNEAYMNYFNLFYGNLTSFLSNSVKDKLYDAVAYRSPSLAMVALGEEPELKNIQIRELSLIKLFYDQFYEKRYPKSNLIIMLDSIRQFSKFQKHRLIAGNVLDRITDLTVGSRFIDFSLVYSNQIDTLTNQKLEGKHIYIHFFDPSIPESNKEIQPLMNLYETYKEYIQFVTVVVQTKDKKTTHPKLPWSVVELTEKDEFIKQCKINSFPCYILIDAAGYIVANPALKPTPNSDYDTIEPYFFQIKRIISGERRRK